MASLYVVLYQFTSATNAKNFVSNNLGIDAEAVSVTTAQSSPSGSWVAVFPENLNQLPTGFTTQFIYDGNTQMIVKFNPSLDVTTITIIADDGTPIFYKGLPVTDLATGPAAGLTGSWIPGGWSVQYKFPKGILFGARIHFSTPDDKYTQVPWGFGLPSNDAANQPWLSSVSVTSLVVHWEIIPYLVFAPSNPGNIDIGQVQVNGSGAPQDKTFSDDWGTGSGTEITPGIPQVTIAPGDTWGRWSGWSPGTPYQLPDGSADNIDFSTGGLSATWSSKGSKNISGGTYGEFIPNSRPPPAMVPVFGELGSICDGGIQQDFNSGPNPPVTWNGTSVQISQNWDWSSITLTYNNDTYNVVATSVPGILTPNPNDPAGNNGDFYALFAVQSN